MISASYEESDEKNVLKSSDLNLKTLIIIPTRNGSSDLARLFRSLSDQTPEPDVVVVDSSSSDSTVEVAGSNGAMVYSIPVSEFNHGGTRQLMVDKNPDYDVYIFMTQDAYLADEHAIEHIRVMVISGVRGDRRMAYPVD